MKKLLLAVCLLSFGVCAWADSLDDQVKAFAVALKANDKTVPGTNPMMGDRMMAEAELQTSLRTPGGEAELGGIVRQMMARYPAEAVQKTGAALLDGLEARKKAKADALKAQIDQVLAHASDTLIKAQKTEQLDGLLGDLQRIESSSGGNYDNDLQAQLNRANWAYQFVAQWQDYLSQRSSGNIQEAQTTLRNLSSSGRAGESALVPRSEILARLVEIGAAAKPATPGGPAPATPTAPDETAILNGIKTLDDMEPAMKALRAVTPNGQTANSQELSQLVELYSNARNGLPVSIDLGQQYTYNGSAAPELDRVKAMLYLYLLPGYIGNGAPAPNPNESVSDYLDRTTEAAAAKQDWKSLQRIIEAKSMIAKRQSAQSGMRSFLAALNQEIAGQYAAAVVSYQGSLRDPDDLVPAKVVGDRLDAIKKDHPAEFEEGMKTVNTAPAINYTNAAMMRASMMGYPVPGMNAAASTMPARPVPPVPTPPVTPNATPVTNPGNPAK